MSRRIWFLVRGDLKSLSLGPVVRYLEMAKMAHAHGFEPILCLDKFSVPPPEGIQLRILDASIIREIRPQDRIVASIFMQPRVMKALLDSRLAFDADFYCVGAMESLEGNDDLPGWRLAQGRTRTILRYRLLLEHAEKIYVSTREQLMFLGGVLFAQGTRDASELASKLPEKTLLVPMGVREDPFPTHLPNPYPKEIQGRPIYLWGGGIWAWFDIPTLLQAFQHLHSEGSAAALFFLCGSNPSGLASQDLPVREARRLTEELGLAGRNVFFLEGGASSSELPAYLAHCTAGIMANPPRLESFGSWRTRLLDLIWAGKPDVTSGYDPLSDQMAKAGTGIMTPHSNSERFATAVQTFRILESESKSVALRQRLAWSSTLAGWTTHISREPPPRGRRSPGILFWFRYLAGIF